MVGSSGERHQTERSMKLETISQKPRSMDKVLLIIPNFFTPSNKLSNRIYYVQAKSTYVDLAQDLFFQ
uniref:Uncharacterized protein n=1 Tax=Megaselia scalaris TaxID=36166 RepID=T1H2G6_MEGSC